MKYQNITTKKILKIVDSVLIGIKFILFFYIVIKYFSSDDKYVRELYGHLVIPFLLYFVINTIRLFAGLKTILPLLMEITLNIIFSFLYGLNHLILLALSAISLLIVSRARIKKQVNENMPAIVDKFDS